MVVHTEAGLEGRRGHSFLLIKTLHSITITAVSPPPSAVCHSPVSPSGVGGGAGASDGPSAQHVQAGAERRWCDSGEAVEVLRF